MILMAALAGGEIIAAVPTPRLDLGAEPVEILLVRPEDDGLLAELRAVAADPAKNVVLRISQATASADPGASWEVFVGPAAGAPCEKPATLVGLIALYGAAQADFAFALDDVIGRTEARGLKARFVPASGVETEGAPAPVKIRTTLRLGAITLEAEAAAD